MTLQPVVDMNVEVQGGAGRLGLHYRHSFKTVILSAARWSEASERKSKDLEL